MEATPSTTGGGSRRRPFLNVREAAQELRLDESTLYRHLREGRFPGVKVGGPPDRLQPEPTVDLVVASAMRTSYRVLQPSPSASI